jgi:hypothetical protein
VLQANTMRSCLGSIVVSDVFRTYKNDKDVAGLTNQNKVDVGITTLEQTT